MDLLRLILARQPIARLLSLPTLLRSPAFGRIRDGIYNLRGKGGQEVKSILSGDLCYETANTIPGRLSTCRAIFLRNQDAFLHYAREDDRGLDFWYALGSGIPEIQAYALAWMSMKLKQDAREDYRMVGDITTILFGIEDPSTIPWNTTLYSQFKNLVQIAMKGPYGRLGFLCGVAGIDLSLDSRSTLDYINRRDYLIQRVRTALDYREIFTREATVYNFLYSHDAVYISTMEKTNIHLHVRMGYFHQIMEKIDDTNSPDLIIHVVNEALDTICYPLLESLTWGNYTKGLEQLGRSVGGNTHITSRKDAENARKCLDNPAIVKLMSQKMVNIYRVIAGDIFEDVVESPYRQVSGNPGKNFNGIPSSASIESAVIYDPNWVISIENDQYLETRAVKYNAARGHISQIRSKFLVSHTTVPQETEEIYQKILQNLRRTV